MLKQEYKSPVQRLARLFKKSRDVWKEKAAQKQKKLRALEIKVRDLSASREKWKAKARAAETQLRQLQSEHAALQKKGMSTLSQSPASL